MMSMDVNALLTVFDDVGRSSSHPYSRFSLLDALSFKPVRRRPIVADRFTHSFSVYEVYFFQITRISKRHAYEITLGTPNFLCFQWR
jgi:hypothetical protein